MTGILAFIGAMWLVSIAAVSLLAILAIYGDETPEAREFRLAQEELEEEFIKALLGSKVVGR